MAQLAAYVLIDYVIRFGYSFLKSDRCQSAANYRTYLETGETSSRKYVICGNTVSAPEDAADDVDANIDRLLRGEPPAGRKIEHNDSL